MKEKCKRIFAAIKAFFLRDGRLRPCIVPVAFLVLLSVLTGVGALRLADAMQYNQTKISQDDEDLGIVEMDVPEGITSIALFGIDARNDSFRGLSDSIMIVTVDAVHNDIKLVSILRDSLVRIDGYGYQKINAAYSFGGPELAIKTLNQTFNLNIRNYATVDFVSMADIIDMVGGIEAELTNAEVRNANTHIASMHEERGTELDYIEESGLQTLNGIQAVAYARIRMAATVNGTLNDTGRTERQRLVMYQLLEKALNMEVSEYPALIRSLMSCVETSLTYGDIFDLAGILTSEGLTFKQAHVPSYDILITDNLNVQGVGSCQYYNLEYAAGMLNAFIYEDVDFEEYMALNGVDRTPWFTGAVADNDPEEPDTDPEEPTTDPENPTTDPEDPTIDPEDPTTDPEDPTTDPEDPTTDPEDPTTDPENPDTDPEDPDTDPEDPDTDPENPDTDPENPDTDPEDPTTDPENPDTDPENPDMDPENPAITGL